jgi:hypothetical protein
MRNREAGNSLIIALVAVLIVAALGVSGWFVYQHNRPQSSSATGSNQTGNPTNNSTTQPTTRTYTSDKEQATFKYPSNWTVTTPVTVSNDPNNKDYIGLSSPSGNIKVSYTTDISGFGNEHTASYPYNIIIDKTAITTAPGLYVVSGITTLDGTTYHPWIAVQDSTGILTTGVQGNLITFNALHAQNSSTKTLGRILFSTSGPLTDMNSPALTQTQATTWLSSAEAQQAKQIMLSFTDQNAQ